MTSLGDKSPPLVALAARQEQYAVTQIIARQGTTLTTTITLAPASTSRPDAHASGAEHGLSSLQLGAILGSVAVVLVLVLAGGICWAHRRRTRVVEYAYNYSRDPYDAPSSDGPPHEPRPGRPRYPPPVAEFIPGGVRYPTYTAVPIRNPRTPRKLGRVYH